MSQTIQQTLTKAAEPLSHVTEVPRLEAEILLAHVLQKPRSYLFAWPEQSVSEEAINALHALLKRRLKGEPLAFLLGEKEFWSLNLEVNHHTLIPRPETELLVTAVLERFSNQEISVLDLGTGSGAIAIALATERPLWQITAVDSSVEALSVAERNAAKHQCPHIRFLQSHWYDKLPDEKYHVIVSNPPYITEKEWPTYATSLQYEPRTALVSGEDGLSDIRIIIEQAGKHLHKGGYLFLEHGYQQAVVVRALLQGVGFQDVQSWQDIHRLDRVTFAHSD